MKKSRFILAMLASSLFHSSAFGNDSGTLRCNGGIVSIGDTAGELVAKCGQPSFTTQREEKKVQPGIRPSEKTITVVTVDDWTFNFGPNEFQYEVLLENGRVTRIQSLDRGY